MILLIGFYEDANIGRRAEFFECIRRNLANDRIDEIHLFVEEALPLDQLVSVYLLLAGPKIRLVAHERRLTYQSLFAYANQQFAGRRVVIANADIYFDDTLAYLDTYSLADKLLCLSRWDVQPDGSACFFEHPFSQDAWIFQAPIHEFACDFHLGVLGCDNRLAWEAHQAGLTLANPGRSIRAHHLHLSGIRRYSQHQRLTGPTKAIPAVFLEAPEPSEPERAPDAPCASIAFHETMGYTIAQLEPGVSSHTNDPRPFRAIPPPLAGLSFTQVVACSVSPVEVEFLSSGKLYVLVGNDWDGYCAATSWLRKVGSKEALPLIETQSGIGFEVWSIMAEAGAQFVVPTQVMLVAKYLEGGERQASRKAPKGGAHVTRDTIFALTSLSPAPQNVMLTRQCIKSWRDAGLHVRAFNHPKEIAVLAKLYDVDFVPVQKTSEAIFGKHLVPINVMLDWAAEQNAPALLINADIELQITDWELKRIRQLSDGGLCYFIRYNHNGNTAHAEREPYGIDAFLFHGRDTAQFPISFLSMGQPFWDYWLPYTFATRGHPIYTVEFPTAFHRNHKPNWSWENWHRCALEFTRISGEPAGDKSFAACVGMSVGVRQSFDQRKVAVPQQPAQIREWVQQRFGYPGRKIFLELGAHQGTDTAWMAEIPDVTIHAFEPDPRNHQVPRHNVHLYRAAIADHDGAGALILSQHGWNQEWTYSSSIKQPKNHLQRFPVSFGAAVEVELVSLNTVYQRHGFDIIDFIWADIQGAEGEMICGGRQALARTRYLYTEYSDDELYDQQATLGEILTLLPEFRVLELWPNDVLLENRELQG